MTISAAGDETLTVAIVHYNTPELTARCLSSALRVLREGLPGAFRIVVVDNCSENEKFEALRAAVAQLDAPELLLVRSCINGGFGLGCMTALNYSAGKFIALVNSDTQFDDDCFSPLIAHLQDHPDIGVIGAQQLSEAGAPVRSVGFNESFLTRLKPRRKHALSAAAPADVDYLFGAFMMFRREAFAQCGGFDPTIFLFYEEMDVCHRLRANGWRVVFFPGASYRHLGQGSVSALSDTKPESDLSLFYVIRKNDGYWAWRLMAVSKLLSYSLRAPFNARARKMLRRLLAMGPPQALSLRVGQTCNFDYINR
ncbi:hypothetical protein GGD83_000017 [Rhodoblastus sphagnicola]|nr:glycosyltransferase family 2 protein [Rhodoblastus sphagnicola]MBB4196246.1 hypothetical protein [Rhodoblastus sphagnicola]